MAKSVITGEPLENYEILIEKILIIIESRGEKIKTTDDSTLYTLLKNAGFFNYYKFPDQLHIPKSAVISFCNKKWKYYHMLGLVKIPKVKKPKPTLVLLDIKKTRKPRKPRKIVNNAKPSSYLEINWSYETI
jgi:hypothetical protein